jgi:hypothetical protein
MQTRYRRRHMPVQQLSSDALRAHREREKRRRHGSDPAKRNQPDKPPPAHGGVAARQFFTGMVSDRPQCHWFF